MNYKDTMATAAMSLMLLGLASFQEISAINVKGNSPRGSSMALSAPPPILLQRSLADDSIEKSQLSALQDLYNATNAISSSNFQDWFRPFTDPLHTHYCNFTGVSCDDDLYVTSLDLNQTGLLGTIPDSIRTLVRLRRFKVWMNDHVGVIPNAFGDLKELESLILGQNSFVGTIPEGLSQVTSLRRLLLQSNDLSGTVPNWLCNLSNLRELDFSRNVGLTGTLPACLGDLPNLREVRVRNAGFSGEIPPVLCARSEFACDGVACGAGTYQFPDGRQTSETTPCLACPTSSSLVIGQMNCDRDLGNTYEPSSSPSLSPSTEPSFRPTVFPSSSPSSNPSVAPSKPPSTAPSTPPSVAPSTIPSLSPSFLPTADLALFPSSVPSTGPTSSMLSTTNSPSSVPSQVMTDYNPATNNTPPSAAPSQEMMTRSPSHIPSVVPTLVPFDFPSFLPSESPSEPVLSPSTDFVIGGLNQGTTDDDAPKNWTWPVIAVILLLALCLLVGLFILARRRRRNRSEHSESLDCFPDDDSASIASSPPPEPVDPFCFPEIKEQRSLHDLEDGVNGNPRETCVEFAGGRGEHSAPLKQRGMTEAAGLETEYEMKVTPSGIEFVSKPALPSECRDDVQPGIDESWSQTSPRYDRLWLNDAREMPSPRHEHKRVTFQLSLEDQYSSDDKWLICEYESSSTDTSDHNNKHPLEPSSSPPPSTGDELGENQHYLGFRRKWLPAE